MFGMPRALFAVLSLTVYHAGAGGTGRCTRRSPPEGRSAVLTPAGWLVQAPGAGHDRLRDLYGGSRSSAPGWCGRSGPRRCFWGSPAGPTDSAPYAARRSAQTLTPDRLRGRTSSVFSLVVTSGPRLGDIESGLVAGLVGALNSVLIGGIGCLVGVGVTMLAFPELERYDADRAVATMRAANEEWRLAQEGARA